MRKTIQILTLTLGLLTAGGLFAQSSSSTGSAQADAAFAVLGGQIEAFIASKGGDADDMSEEIVEFIKNAIENNPTLADAIAGHGNTLTLAGGRQIFFSVTGTIITSDAYSVAADNVSISPAHADPATTTAPDAEGTANLVLDSILSDLDNGEIPVESQARVNELIQTTLNLVAATSGGTARANEVAQKIAAGLPAFASPTLVASIVNQLNNNNNITTPIVSRTGTSSFASLL